MDSNNRTNYFQIRYGKFIIPIVLLLISIGVRLPGLFSRSIWFDESVTLLETAGHGLPAWPSEPAPAHLAKDQFEGVATFRQIVHVLRSQDVNPPLYYWSVCIWKRWWGSSLIATRGFSLACSVTTVLALYGFLYIAGFEYPFIPTLIYALSSSSVHWGQEARAYALAILLIVLAILFAYLCTETTLQSSRWRFAACSMGMAMCSGAAFLTHYLTLFSVGVILIWFVANVGPAFRARVIGPLMLTASVALLGLFTLSGQHYEHLPYFGFLSEARDLVKMNLSLIWKPAFEGGFVTLIRYLILGLILTGVLLLVRHWPGPHRKVWLLLLALAIAPSSGFMVLDLVTKRHLHDTRYLLWAGPALAVVAANGIVRLTSARPPWGWGLLGVLLAVQLTGINWGKEIDSFINLRWRSVAKVIQKSSSSSPIVVIGSGSAQAWYPAALIYELDPDVTMVTLGSELDLDTLAVQIKRYDHVWVVCSPKYGNMNTTRTIENEFLNRLQGSGGYKRVGSYLPCDKCDGQPAVLLRRS